VSDLIGYLPTPKATHFLLPTKTRQGRDKARQRQGKAKTRQDKIRQDKTRKKDEGEDQNKTLRSVYLSSLSLFNVTPDASQRATSVVFQLQLRFHTSSDNHETKSRQSKDKYKATIRQGQCNHKTVTEQLLKSHKTITRQL
jgi:hypothetical protein